MWARALFWNQGRKFQKQRQNLCHQGLNIEVRGAIRILGPPGAGFLNYVSPGGGTCQVMHSGAQLCRPSGYWVDLCASRPMPRTLFGRAARRRRSIDYFLVSRPKIEHFAVRYKMLRNFNFTYACQISTF